jgi:hypothetical protein
MRCVTRPNAKVELEAHCASAAFTSHLQGEVCTPRIGSLANSSVMAVGGSMSAAIACISSQRSQHMLPEFPEDAQRHDLRNHGDHDPHRE